MSNCDYVTNAPLIQAGDQNKTYPNGQAGALYGEAAPLVNACRKPGEWQSYDIIFHAPRQSTGGKAEAGSVTVQSPDQSFAAAGNEPCHLSLDFVGFHAWLCQAALDAIAQFADNKSARDRQMQIGQAWRAFVELFGGFTVLELLTLYSNLLCFAATDHPAASVFLQAFRPLRFEYDN